MYVWLKQCHKTVFVRWKSFLSIYNLKEREKCASESIYNLKEREKCASEPIYNLKEREKFGTGVPQYYFNFCKTISVDFL